jgi:hypothetical protein
LNGTIILDDKRGRIRKEAVIAHFKALGITEDKCALRNITYRKIKCVRHVGRMGEIMNIYNILVGKPEGKRPVGRPRNRLADNIRMDLTEIE